MNSVIKNYPIMINKLNDADIVILSRYIEGSKDERNQFRVIVSYLLNKFSIFFYLGVRENTQGHHLTITEKGQGYKNNVFMTIPTALEFQKCLESMIKFYKGLDSTTDMINNT